MLREIWLLETHHSTAIEGSSLTPQGVVAVVERNEARDSLAEALEVKAYSDAAGWVYGTAPETPQGITLATVREVYRRVVGPVWAAFPPTTRDAPGDFRTTGVTVGGGRRVQLSAAPAVHADMSDWVAASGGSFDAHPILHITGQHARFERIHPFTDGNGVSGVSSPTGDSSRPTTHQWSSGSSNVSATSEHLNVPTKETRKASWNCSPERSANRSTDSSCPDSPVMPESSLSAPWRRAVHTHPTISASLPCRVDSARCDTGHCGSAPKQRSRSTWTAEARVVADDPRTLKNENRTQTTQDASSFTAPSISHIPR